MALTKLDKNLLGFSDDTDFVKLPSGTTGQRPSSAAAGQFRFNTTIGDAEVYDGTAWQRMGIAPPTFSSVDYPGDDTALDPAGGQSLIINGSTFNTGVTVTIGGTTPSSITRNSATQLTVTAPAKSAGTYTLVITNTDGGTATASNAVSYNGIPAFSNAAGTLGTFEAGATVSVSAAATEPDGGAIGYTITSGSLPSGVSINASTGAITGTAGSVLSNTTSNFTVTATDNENQSTARAYSITVTPKLPSDNFNIKLYTGNGSAQSLTGVGFKPDIIWIKQRNDTNPFAVYDSSRGAGKLIRFDNYEAESGNSGNLLASFDADGFSVNRNYLTHTAYDTTNHNNSTYSAMCWKVNGGTTSTNTLGEINSTVQVNDGAGVSIVQFAGISDPGEHRSFGHGLSAAPDIIIMKRREANQHPAVFAKINGGWEYFDGMTSTDGGGDYDSGITVTSTLIDIVDYPEWFTDAGHNYVYWCWRSVAGYSKISSYTGNGSSNGPIVQTDFEPAFLMIKRVDSTSYWSIYDNKRNTANPRTKFFKVNEAAAETTDTNSYSVDFLSNGFQIKGDGSNINNNSSTYLYMAFAADPDTTTPTLADSFNTVAYVGNGSATARNITTGFKPDLTWIKGRDTAGKWQVWYDSIRGATNMLASNSANAATTYGSVTPFSTGFTLATTGGDLNSNGENYISWNWKAGGDASINTDGNSNSIVSTNTNAGFSVVKYTGTGSNATVGHGLSAAPEMVIVKNLSNSHSGNAHWAVYHTSLGATKVIYLNRTNAAGTSNSFWNNTAPTSTTFSVGTDNDVNVSGEEFIAYCFRGISGFSKFGTYNGTGSTQSITGLGFQPNWVMIKRTDGTENWYIQDSVRGSTKQVYANLTNAEYNETGAITSFGSDGWTMGNYTGINNNGQTYIYAAFKIN